MQWCEDWRLLPQRVALHEPSATAALADAHLGYSAARQRLGDAIPWRDVAQELQPLCDAAKKHDLRRLFVAGDLFERGYEEPIHRQFLDFLDRLRIDFLGLVPGNHDRGLDKAVLALPLFPEGCNLEGWRIVHGDQPIGGAHVVMGHWHPATHWKRRKMPCFLTRGRHLVLPAFSLDAAGVEVHNEPRWQHWNCYAIDGNEIVHVRSQSIRAAHDSKRSGFYARPQNQR